MGQIRNIAAGILLLAVGCTRQTPEEFGTISVSLSGAPRVKSYELLTPQQAASFNVAVYDTDGAIQGSVRKYANFTAAKVALGKTYYVTAESCTAKEAETGLGCLRLEGRSENASLTKAAPDAVLDVYCSVANASFEYVLGQDVQEYLKDISVSVVTSDNPSRNVVLDIPEQTVWVNVGAASVLSYEISATSMITGTPMTLRKELNLSAGDHITVTVKVESDKGRLGSPEITVDSHLTEKESAWNFDIYDFE